MKIMTDKEYRRRIEMALQKDRDERYYRENVDSNFRETNRRIDEAWKEIYRLQRLIEEKEDKKTPANNPYGDITYTGSGTTTTE